MQVVEQQAEHDQNRHLQHRHHEIRHDSRHEKVLNTHRRGHQSSQYALLLIRDERERNAEQAGLHDRHRNDTGNEEVDVGQVPAVNRLCIQSKARLDVRVLKRRLIDKSVHDRQGSARLLGLAGVVIGGKGERPLAKRCRQHHDDVAIASIEGRALGIQAPGVQLHYVDLPQLGQNDLTHLVVRVVDDTYPHRDIAVAVDQAENDDDHHRKEKIEEDDLSVPQVHLEGGDC